MNRVTSALTAGAVAVLAALAIGGIAWSLSAGDSDQTGSQSVVTVDSHSVADPGAPAAPDGAADAPSTGGAPLSAVVRSHSDDDEHEHDSRSHDSRRGHDEEDDDDD